MISENYIRTLLVQNPKINIIDFAKQYNLLTKNIDISFNDEFLYLVKKNECCIGQELLIKYGVTSMTGGSGDIKKIIERNDGQEGSDYEVSQLAYSLDYVLHPTFFKKILIRSRNTDKFADYYLFLEEVIFLFSELQIQN